MDADHQTDLDAIRAIPAVTTILDVVCRSTGMGFAAVARVTEERWIACSVKDDIGFGLVPGGELRLDTTICHEIRDSRQAVVINHVAEHPEFCRHATPALYGFQSYISMPILLPDGRFFGTLCAIDPKPAQLENPETIGMFRLFAELIGHHLDAGERARASALASAAALARAQDALAASAASLAEERSTAALREEFVAILGHDLRNPISAIESGIRMVQATPVDSTATMVLGMMQQSVLRMSELVSNMLDFARVRLGGGIGLNRVADADLAGTLRQVVGELGVVWPERRIGLRLELTEPVECDPARIGQLCSNLLSNALTHGPDAAPIRVEASAAGGVFTLSVANDGPPIPPATIGQLFKPFSRGGGPQAPQGLGLGLHIAAEIARAHGGSLSVTSEAGETRFVLRMPADTRPA
ncbi:GAF domain-containing sensor histidine kinase [Roseomonas sp. 18066]|uniref:GAF domain-containing sensor histidine kinase n=1 Tax=Roseomonas sp. 18066 TaxID=2681412 RepID=UPI0013599B3C|nr:GAF domain-containing sensor histidine kinase [Roseomonas sp. 18066]